MQWRGPTVSTLFVQPPFAPSLRHLIVKCVAFLPYNSSLTIYLSLLNFFSLIIYKQNLRSYRYDDTGTGRCGIQSDAIPTSSNIVLQFFALGDFPYDEESTTTASGVNKAKCGTDNSDDSPENADTCTYGGRSFKCTSECTYEGQEYACWRDDIIPWMKNPERTSSSSWVTAAKPAFSVHVGDFLKGNGSGNSGRCNPDSFASRQALFAGEYQHVSNLFNSKLIRLVHFDSYAFISANTYLLQRHFDRNDKSTCNDR